LIVQVSGLVDGNESLRGMSHYIKAESLDISSIYVNPALALGCFTTDMSRTINFSLPRLRAHTIATWRQQLID